MALKVNQTSLRKAKSFISQGKIDATGSWSFSADDGNKMLGPNGDDWENYASYHLAEDTSANDNTKAKYRYPWGKGGLIYRRGVIAVKSRAAAQGETAIAGAADSLLQEIDKKIGKEDSLEPIQGELLQNNLRIDFTDFEDIEEFLEEPFKETPEGFLKGRAIFTNIGVFPYRLDDGSIRWELRPPEEVFKYESVNSFKLLPMTNDHPNYAVTVDNIKNVQVGYTGEDIKTSPYHLSIPIVLTDKMTIDACQERKKRALSAGYNVDLEMTDGVWMGVPYDAIQRNIRGNHIAIVDRGRAGDDAVMKFDSAHSVGILQTDITQAQNFNDRRNNMSLKKLTIDGVEYEAEQKIIDLYTDAQKELEQVKADFAAKIKDIETISAERDQFKEDVLKLKTDLETSKQVSSEVLEKAVQERLVVLDAANRANVEIKEAMTDIDIKKAVIISVSPSAKEKLDNCSLDYLESRFDVALEKLEDIQKVDNSLSGDSLSHAVKEERTDNIVSTSYKKMIQDMQEAHKRKEVN